MVAAHNNDLKAAQQQGLKTAFVARPTEYGPLQNRDFEATGEWDIVAEDLPGLPSGWDVERMTPQIKSRNADVMGGAAVFHGTRVPLQALLDCLEAGESIDDFLEGFPWVTRELVIAFLEEAKPRI